MISLLRLLDIRENKAIECALVNFQRISDKMELYGRSCTKGKTCFFIYIRYLCSNGMKYILDIQIKTSRIFVLERNMVISIMGCMLTTEINAINIFKDWKKIVSQKVLNCGP